MRLSGQFLAYLFFFFLQKNFKLSKTQIKPKPTNKTKTTEQKTTKATIFCTQKHLKDGKLFTLRFGAFFMLKFFRTKIKQA